MEYAALNRLHNEALLLVCLEQNFNHQKDAKTEKERKEGSVI